MKTVIHLRKFREWLLTVTDHEIQEELELAVEGIECEGCGTTKSVYFSDFGHYCFFYCLPCMQKTREELPSEPKNSRGLTLRFKVLARDGFRCVYCGRSPVEDGVKLEIDHVVPKSKGGTDSFDNLVAACWECNQGKKNLIISWRR